MATQVPLHVRDGVRVQVSASARHLLVIPARTSAYVRDLITIGRRAQRATRAGGRKRGTDIKDEAAKRREPIRAEAEAYRQTHAYHRRRASTEHLIAHVAAQLDLPPIAVRRALKALRLC